MRCDAMRCDAMQCNVMYVRTSVCMFVCMHACIFFVCFYVSMFVGCNKLFSETYNINITNIHCIWACKAMQLIVMQCDVM